MPTDAPVEPSTPGGSRAVPTERRIVSVLFADLVDFTPRAEVGDPEEIRELLDRYYGAASQLIARYGGTIEKFAGDAVMAVWGAPTAREDDAERAVRAALELVTSVPQSVEADPPLTLRAAILTGEAAVIRDADGQVLVAGDLVNTASRLQAIAPPGAVLIGEATQRAVADTVATEPIGKQALKGKVAPVPAWVAVRVIASRGGQRRAERLEAPFVGRERELRLLKELYHATADEGRMRLVSVIGIAGIGKSRLAWEFEKYVDGLLERVHWHTGRSLAYGEGVAYWALAEMVRSRTGIAETDELAVARQKMAAALDDFLPDADEQRWIAPRLGGLLGLEDTPPGERDELFGAWRRFFERVAEQAPVVLAFEDLQWADAGLIDFIEHLLERSRGSRILVLALARPDLRERRPAWGAGQRNFTSLDLEPLPGPAMRALLAGLVPGLPKAAVARILERAEGVPLYAVETVRMLLDDGRLIPADGRYSLADDLTDLAVPDSLRSLIAARLDGLVPADRVLIQDASILGISFTLDGLATLTGVDEEALRPRLATLIQRELLVLDEDPRSPERGQYRFVQGIIKEVAHDTMSRRERRARHLAAARYYESVGDESLAGVLASHYVDALRATPTGPDADSLATQTRLALRAAAERAGTLGSHDEAVADLEIALSITVDPIERADLAEAIGREAYEGGRLEVAEAHARLALDDARDRGEMSAVARRAALVGRIELTRSHVRPALEVLESALAQATALGDDENLVSLQAELARAFMMQIDSRAVALADTALDLAERLELQPLIIELLITKGSALSIVGRFREGEAILEGARVMAARAGIVSAELRAAHNLFVSVWQDDPRRANALAASVYELARERGQRWRADDALGWLTNGTAPDWDWALRTIAELDESTIEPSNMASFLSNAGWLLAQRGEFAEARERFDRAHQLIGTSTRADAATFVHLDDAALALAEGRLDAGYEAAAAAFDVTHWAFVPSVMARAAVWARDLDRLRRARQALDVAPDARGRLIGAWRRSMDAGIAALEGRQAEAIDAYRAVHRDLRDLDTLELGFGLLDAVTLVGVDDPDSVELRQWAEEARAIFTGFGAQALLDRLQIALARRGAKGSRPRTQRRSAIPQAVASSPSGRP